MANKNQLVRYLIIDELLRDKQNPFPAKQEIIDTCIERTDQEYSPSSFEKDVSAMRTYFSAPIEFHNGQRGYFYGWKEKNAYGEMSYEIDAEYKFLSISLSKKDVLALNFAESVLESFKDIAVFDQFSDAVDKVLDAVEIGKQLGVNHKSKPTLIQMDAPSYVKGSHLLADLLRAIREKKQVSFVYQKFNADTSTTKTVHPFLLKEFKGRWYLIAYNEDREAVATFGLDRMRELLITSKKAIDEEKANFNAQTYYASCYGITRMQGQEPEEIILSFDPLQGNYLKTRPIHPSQKELLNNEEEYRIALKLLINTELIMELLSYGHGVKVIKPQKLVEQIRETLRKTLYKYDIVNS